MGGLVVGVLHTAANTTVAKTSAHGRGIQILNVNVGLLVGGFEDLWEVSVGLLTEVLNGLIYLW